MIRKTSLLAAAAAALLAVSASADAQTAYRWTDKDGKIHYSDQPPPTGNAEAKNFSAKAADPSMSWTLREATENFPVVLYTSPNCGPLCNNARTLLQARGIPFNEITIGTAEDIVDFNKIFGEGAGLPAATVGATLLKGFETGAWNRQLDRVGYPKTE
jgi:hypothetical protein